jgi:hypothetical protein
VIFFEFDFSVIRRVEYASFGMRLFVFRDALGASGPVVQEWLRGGKYRRFSLLPATRSTTVATETVYILSPATGVHPGCAL